jgi:hypothetical protein
VIGVLGASLRRVLAPGGDERTLLYLGDLKIAPRARGGMLLIRLMRAIAAWSDQRTDGAFAVVMDGSARVPTSYTGRLGIPAFAASSSVGILWLHTGGTASSSAAACLEVAPVAGMARFAALAPGRYRLPFTGSATRSAMMTQWLISPDGQACGRLEDTLLAKRLSSIDGADMRSAHLSCFAHGQLDAAVAVLESAAVRAAQAGYPMLFVAIDPQDADALTAAFGPRIHALSHATIYATGLPIGSRWIINTAEI